VKSSEGDGGRAEEWSEVPSTARGRSLQKDEHRPTGTTVGGRGSSYFPVRKSGVLPCPARGEGAHS